MSREKQIEEMALSIHSILPIGLELSAAVATDLYNADYRKQSEGEWKQTTESLGAHDVDCVECSVCGESWVLDEDFDYDVVVDFWHYCPNCGAHMKGGAE